VRFAVDPAAGKIRTCPCCCKPVENASNTGLRPPNGGDLRFAAIDADSPAWSKTPAASAPKPGTTQVGSTRANASAFYGARAHLDLRTATAA
jgi:hypothetical protein